MSQASLDTRALTAEPVYPYRGPITTAGIRELRDGEFRSQRAAIGTSMLNCGWELAIGPLELSKQLAAKGLHGERLKAELNRQLSRQLYLDTAAEMLPDSENRIVPDFDKRDALGLPRPRIRIKFDDYAKAGLEIARQRHDAICQALQCTVWRQVHSIGLFAAKGHPTDAGQWGQAELGLVQQCIARDL